MAGKIRLEDRECPLSATLGLVGEWWTLLILHDAFDGYTRFDQFQENLGHLLEPADQPAEAHGRRRAARTAPVPGQPARYEYVLTELGRSLRPVVVVLAAWGNARLGPRRAQHGARGRPDRGRGRTRPRRPRNRAASGRAGLRVHRRPRRQQAIPGPVRNAPQATAAMTSACPAGPPRVLGLLPEHADSPGRRDGPRGPRHPGRSAIGLGLRFPMITARPPWLPGRHQRARAGCSVSPGQYEAMIGRPLRVGDKELSDPAFRSRSATATGLRQYAHSRRSAPLPGRRCCARKPGASPG